MRKKGDYFCFQMIVLENSDPNIPDVHRTHCGHKTRMQIHAIWSSRMICIIERLTVSRRFSMLFLIINHFFVFEIWIFPALKFSFISELFQPIFDLAVSKCLWLCAQCVHRIRFLFKVCRRHAECKVRIRSDTVSIDAL